jgi:hypothetical protein
VTAGPLCCPIEVAMLGCHTPGQPKSTIAKRDETPSHRREAPDVPTAHGRLLELSGLGKIEPKCRRLLVV